MDGKNKLIGGYLSQLETGEIGLRASAVPEPVTVGSVAMLIDLSSRRRRDALCSRYQ